MTDADQSRTRPLAVFDFVCPACNHTVSVPFFRSQQPLATIAWPESAREADGLAVHDLDFVRCVSCGHVTNRAFSYENVPYGQPNLMFNRGTGWSSLSAMFETWC